MFTVDKTITNLLIDKLKYKYLTVKTLTMLNYPLKETTI